MNNVRTMRIFALVLFVAAVSLRSILLGGIAMVIGGATVLTALWQLHILRNMRVGRNIQPTLVHGDAAEVEITVKNGSLLPLAWLQIVESVPTSLRITQPPHVVTGLGAGAEHRLRYAVRGTQRGWYQLGPTRLILGDVLGLGTERLEIPPTELTVLPRVVPVTTLALPAALPFGPLHAVRHAEDPARPTGVRAYQPGDGVRRIDWKASARSNEVMVRRADPAIAPETTLALALRRTDYPARILQDALERAITATASLAIALLGRKLPVGLVTNGLDPKGDQHHIVLPQAKGNGQRTRLLEALGRLQAGAGQSLWELLAVQHLPWGGTLVVILSDLVAEDIAHLQAQTRRGQHIALFLVEPTPTGIGLAQRYRFGYWRVDDSGRPVPPFG